MNYPVLTPRAGGVRARAKKRLLIALLSVACGWTPVIGHAATRAWTGHISSLWSNPNNCDPAGVPQNGEELYFLDNTTTTMVNDVAGHSVGRLVFSNNSFETNCTIEGTHRNNRHHQGAIP